MTDLIALLERVKAATRPDRILDGDIALALALVPKGWRRGVPEASATSSWWSKDDSDRYDAPDLTGSIDTALVLVETKLPGWWIQYLGQVVNPVGWAIRIEGGQRPTTSIGLCYATTAPLAILAALLSALIAQDKAA